MNKQSEKLAKAIAYEAKKDVYKRQILDGACDEIPESCFLFAGNIDEVFEKAKVKNQ